MNLGYSAPWRRGNGFVRAGFSCMTIAIAIAAAPAVCLAANKLDSSNKTAPRVQFDKRFLNLGQGSQPLSDVDLDMFGASNSVVAGHYLVNVVFNGRSLGLTPIDFESVTADVPARACITPSLLAAWGVNLDALPDGTASARCVDLATSVPSASIYFDQSAQRIEVSVPQAVLARRARDSFDGESVTKANHGIDAAMLDYRFGASSGNIRNDGAPSRRVSQQFLGLGSGINLGNWRLRQFTTYNHTGTSFAPASDSVYDKSNASPWRAVSTSAQRDIESLNGQLLVGEAQTPGEVMESIGFRGAQLASDAAMLPDSQQGFAPTVRGFAQTQAKVSIRQHGYSIYTTYVAPGEFIIDDLYPTGGSGDLQVTVTEANGRETSFTQPYASVPTLLREGAWRYNIAAGQFRSGDAEEGGATFLQGTLVRGLGKDVTAFGGTLVSPIQRTMMLGIGRNIPWLGAASVDLTRSQTFTPDSFTGYSTRWLYARTFVDTFMPGSTAVRMSGYRHSSEGFRTFAQAVSMNEELPATRSSDADRIRARKNEWQLELVQQMGAVGSMNFSVHAQRYWATDRIDRFVQMGWTSSWGVAQYSVFLSAGRDHGDRVIGPKFFDLAVSVSMPLDAIFGGTLQATAASAEPSIGNGFGGLAHSQLNYTVASQKDGPVSHRASVFGNLLDDRSVSYALGTSIDSSSSASQGSQGARGSRASPASNASVSLQRRAGVVDASWSQSKNYSQGTIGANGSVVLHSGGVTFAQGLGETIGIASTSGIGNIGFDNLPGTTTDDEGYAVLPYLAAFRTNRIALRTRDLAGNVEVKSAVAQVHPSRGAVVPLNFEVTRGYRILFTLIDTRGLSIPFGAVIENESGQEIAVVGPEGQAFVMAETLSGSFRVRWGDARQKACVLPYSIEANEEAEHGVAIHLLDGICSPAGADRGHTKRQELTPSPSGSNVAAR